MFKVGVVGPVPSVQRIITSAEMIEKEIKFIPFPYTIVHETKEIVETNNEHVNFWLFSGVIPYTIAVKTNVPTEKMDYIYHSRNDTYNEVLKFIITHQIIPKNISIDSLKSEEFNIYNDDFLNNTPHITFHPNFYDEKTSIDEIFHFHYELWQQGKIDVAITSYPAVEQRLKEQNIPVYWSGPSKMNIYYSLQVILEKIKTKYYKDTQTTAIVFKIDQFDQLKIVQKASYDLEFLLLDLKKLILQCCKRLEGFLVENMNGQYTIFTTRGLAERHTANIEQTMQFITSKIGQPTYVGIGHANTAFNAEKYAIQAIQHIAGKKQAGIIVMRDDGTLIERTNLQQEIEYSSVNNDVELLKKLERTTISAKIYYRIQAVVQQLNWSSFSANDLATELEMTERNAQRIISELLKAELVEVAGEVQRNRRGRATKLYKLSIK